ncbi:MAG TPA: hypothetical protein VFN71_01885 [Methylomirabilota bacterium]|nr:hypothetical protein [Methylomirabilota bacterium]
METMITGRLRILRDAVLVVLALLPLHFFAERRGPTVMSIALALVMFFGPVALAAVQMEAPTGNLLRRTLAHLRFGIVLGLGIGVVGGVENLLLHVVTGEPLQFSPAVWSVVAVLLAAGTGLAYGLLLCFVRGLGGLLARPAGGAGALLFGADPVPWRTALFLSLVPGLGHFALGQQKRGRPYLLWTLGSGVAGLGLFLVALIVLVEGGVLSLPLLSLGAALLLFPLVLVVASALDIVFVKVP